MPHGDFCVSRFIAGQVVILLVLLANFKVMSFSVSRSMLHLRRCADRSVASSNLIFPSRPQFKSERRHYFIRKMSSAPYDINHDGWPEASVSNSAVYTEPASPTKSMQTTSLPAFTDTTDTESDFSSTGYEKLITKRTRVPAVAPLSREQMKPNVNSYNSPDWDYVSSIPIDPAEVLKRCTERSFISSTSGADMELTFIGTASCTPSLSRGVACVAMRHGQDVLLFDCGEGAQLQLMRAAVRISRIRRIFVTHLHGDHAFGLAGVLCMMGQALHHQNEHTNESSGRSEQIEPVEIFGPEGIRDMVRAVVQLSYSMVVPPHRIHELKNIPKPPGIRHVNPATVRTRQESRFNELDGSRDIYPDIHGHYYLYTDKDVTVTAASMVHSIPCVGYVVTEHDRPGSLRTEVVDPIIHANQESLNTVYLHAATRAAMEATLEVPKEALHGNQKLPETAKKTVLTKNRGAIHAQRGKQKQLAYWRNVYKDLKAMKPDDVFRFPDGTVLKGSDVMDPPIQGRKIVYMGDTCSAECIENLARNCDVLIHEATNAFFPGMTRFDTQKGLENNTKRNGHSTPEMAAQEAYRMNAKALLMTHFSARYQGDTSEESVTIMMQIEGMARRAYENMLLARGSPSSDGVTTLHSGGSMNSPSSSSSKINSHHSEGDSMTSDTTGLCIPIVAAYDFMKYPVYRKVSHDKKE